MDEMFDCEGSGYRWGPSVAHFEMQFSVNCAVFLIEFYFWNQSEALMKTCLNH